MPEFFRECRRESFGISPRLRCPCEFPRQVRRGSRRRAARSADLAIECKGAVVAGTEVAVARGHEFHEATGVRTHDVESRDGLWARAAEIDGANGGLRRFVPRVGAAGEDGEFAWRAVLGNRAQRSDE